MEIREFLESAGLKEKEPRKAVILEAGQESLDEVMQVGRKRAFQILEQKPDWAKVELMAYAYAMGVADGAELDG
jgi:ribosomal protein S19E (S16A)